MWDKLIEKTVGTDVKASLQPLFRTKEIDSKCLRGHRPLVKIDKNKANREHLDETPKNKAKSHNSSFAN